ncbi:tetratricopeptide repeat protein [Rubrivirga sp.]|uniref:tetratricopeptide repeat protein n=1 Tax=Rubrivirga sp. TaxID=1885344 RepID=UPI003B51F747
MRTAVLLVLLSAGGVAAQTGAGAARSQGRFVRALTSLALEDYERAARSLDEVLAQAPDDPTVLALRAEVAGLMEAPADAVYYARRATDAAPDDARAWLALASALRAASQPAQAADALDRALALAPTDPDALTAAADLAAERGDADAERRALGALVRVGDTVAARLRLSALAEQAGDADQALAHAQAAARLAPAEPAVMRRLADLQRGPVATAPAARPTNGADGAGLFAAGRFAEAADALLAEVDADPRRVESWALALQALAQTADPRAGATADDALLLFPTAPAVLAGAAEAYGAAGRTDDARAVAQRGLDALDLLGDRLPDTDALRVRLDAVLSR